MKKLIIFFVFLCLVSSCLLFFDLPLGMSNIYNMCSQIEFGYMNLFTDRYFAEYSFGEREKEFEYDGISTEKVDYGVIKLKFYENTNFANEICAKVKIDGNELSVFLIKNPFENNYVCDTQKIGKNVELKIENVDDEFKKLDYISNGWKSSYKQVLEKCFKFMNKEIKTNKRSGVKNEIFLTIIYGDEKENINYFWNFTIVNSKYKSKNIVLDISTLDFLVIK